MSEPVLSDAELRRYTVSGVGGHGAQGEPGTRSRSRHETPAAPDLYQVLRSVVVAHRVPMDEVDALTRDLIEVLPPQSPPFSPDLDLIGDLHRGQRAAWTDPR